MSGHLLGRMPRSLAGCLSVSLCLCFIGLLYLVAGTAVAQQNLPDLGEPADNALSLSEETELGAEFMRQIRSRVPLVRDVQIEEFIQTLGQRLALASGKPTARTYRFFIIDEPQINAFAIPGGYIGVNSGLIDAMAIEEQLAGVLAHEVAHLTQRHHARSFATNTRNSLSAAATILAAVLIGQASPEAGQAALAAGLAATQQSVINFTRANEVEADRIGIDILANAAYDPGAMAESFSILRQRNRLNTSADQLEYLRTHPLDNNRIAEARDRAAAKPERAAAAQIDYQLFKGRLAVLTTDDPGQLERTYRAQSARSPAVTSAYALALLDLQANRLEQAGEHIATLRELAPQQLMAELLHAQWQEATGDPAASRATLLLLEDLYESPYSVIERIADLDVRSGRPSRAGDRLVEYLRGTDHPDPLAWRQLASIQQRLDDPAGSHESLARYFEALDEPARAISQLELALREVAAGSQDELRLAARLKVMKAEQVERQRRRQ